MTKRVSAFAFLLTGVTLIFPTASSLAYTAGSTDGVVSVLLKKYTLAETTGDKSQITKDGTQLSLKQAGVYSFALKQPKITSLSFKSLADPRNFGMVDNKVVDGKVQKQNSAVSQGCGTAHCHVFQTGDKIYVTKIESKPDNNNDLLKFTIISADNIDGGEGAERYGATVSFKFKKGYLTESSPEDVEAAVEAVMAPGDDSADSGKSDTAAASAPAAAQPAAPVQRAAAPVQCAVAAAPTGPLPDLSIGERWSEVLKGYGMPTQIIDLGKKVTFIYKDSKTKVVFTDDKISAMEPL